MTSVGYATLDVIPSFKGLQRELDKGTTGPLRSAGTKGGTLFGDAAGKSGGARFGQVFKKAAQAGIVGAAALAAGSIKLAFDSISAASDLEESTNKVSQVFGDAADSVLKFTSTTADSLGQTNTQAREAAATFGIFGSAAGLADRKNAKFAKRMTTLASDLASFNNTDPSQAVEALGAALRGESEPIRAYGVMLDEATLKAEALRLGILKPVKDQSKIFAYQTRITDLQGQYNDAVKENGKGSLDALKAEAALGTARTALQKATEGTLPPLTNQQKLLAAQSEIFKQTNVAQGDFARTSDGLANQQRRLSARFEDAKARLGKGLLPIMTDAADFLLDKGIPAFEDFSDFFTEKGVPALKKFADKVKPAVRLVGDLVGAFADLPTSDKLGAFTGAIGGGIVVKHQFAKIFERGGIANPMFVVVTNPGASILTTTAAAATAGGGAAAVETGLLGGGAAAWGARAASVFRSSVAKGGKITLGIVIADSILPEPDENRFLKVFGDAGRTFGEAARDTFGNKNTTKTQANGDPNPFSSLYKGDPKDVTAKINTALDLSRAKAAGFGRELDLVGARKIDPNISTDGFKGAKAMLSDFVGLQIEAGRPVTPYINTTDIERAIGVARTLNDALRNQADVGRGADGGVNYQHGGTGGTSPRAGITIERMDVHGVSLDDALRDGQKRTQRKGLGGRP